MSEGAPKIQTDARFTCSYRAWTGTSDQLVRIVEEVTRLMLKWERPLDERFAAEVDPEDDSPYMSEWRAKNRQERLQEMKNSLLPQISAEEKEFSLRRSGSLSDVLASVDLRYVQELSVDAPSSFYSDVSLNLTFSKQKGVRLSLRSSNPDWVREAASSLTGLLERDVPWWNWFRSNPMFLIYDFALIVSCMIPAYKLNIDFTTMMLATFILSMAGAIALEKRVAGYFTGFELVESGRDPRGTRAALALSSFLLTVATEVVVAVLIG